MSAAPGPLKQERGMRRAPGAKCGMPSFAYLSDDIDHADAISVLRDIVCPHR